MMRASQGANTLWMFCTERLACMLFAYMTLESATYTQNAVNRPSSGRNPAGDARTASAAVALARWPRVATAGATRSAGVALMAREAPLGAAERGRFAP